jgi:hypothetical protein
MPITQSFICRERAVRTSATSYTIANIPNANTEQIFANGVLQNFGPDNDYTLSGKTITFNRNIEADEVILVNYILDVFVAPPEDATITGKGLEGRKNLIHWCLRKLGAPVIDINVDEDQIEDRIDEALLYFRDYHFDGVERVYLRHQVTASSLKLEAPFTGEIQKGATIVGQTSGAAGYVYDKYVDGTTVRFKHLTTAKFIKGETVAIDGTSDTFQIQNSDVAVTLGDVDNHYITLNQKVLSITNIIPQESSSIGGNLGGMFDFQYQFALNNMFNLASTDLVTYDIYKRYISQWEFMFRGARGIRFNRKTDRVELDIQDWIVDQWIVLECWSALEPSTFTEIYTDEFVREYAYSLIKQQWGANLKKFSGISLPGGVLLNGQQIYDEATAELEKLRERVRKEFELPPDFLIG